MRHFENTLSAADYNKLRMAAPQKEGFYQKLGFNVRPNESEGAGMNLWLTGKKQEVL